MLASNLPQASPIVVMIRPHHFCSNPETMQDNHFQSQATAVTAHKAYDEVTEMVKTLENAGITVHLFEDTSTLTPDAVYPNNWFSTHTSGDLILYPMYSASRRKERRTDIIAFLQQHYGFNQLLDLSHYETEGLYLEGTGAIVFDHQQRLAFAARSNRMSEKILTEVCQHLQYQPVVFSAVDANHQPIYHTNVMMMVGQHIALICADAIQDATERKRVRSALRANGRQVIEITLAQMSAFAGNALELINSNHQAILALSTTAWNALTDTQQRQLAHYYQVLSFAIPTIEHGGGSVRCMLAQIFLSLQKDK